MRAILQGKHNRLCSLVKESKLYAGTNAADISELEDELLLVYDEYKIRMNDLRGVIDLYLQVEKAILARLKENRRMVRDSKEIQSGSKIDRGNLNLNSQARI